MKQRRINRWGSSIECLNNKIGMFGGLVVLFMTLFIAMEVVGRYIFNHPFSWTYELNNYLLVALGVLAGAFTLQEKAHARIDIIADCLSPPNQLKLELFTSVLTIIFLLWLGWLTIGYAIDSLVAHQVSSQEVWPLFPVKVLLPIGIAMMIAQLVKQWIQGFNKLKKL